MIRSPKSRTILVVDDEPMVQEILYGALQEEGHEVYVADCLQAARKELERHPISLVITDVCLSRVSPKEGLDLVHYVRSHHPHTEVIIMSADLSPAVKDRAEGQGATHCFEKPFDLADIIRCVGTGPETPSGLAPRDRQASCPEVLYDNDPGRR